MKRDYSYEKFVMGALHQIFFKDYNEARKFLTHYFNKPFAQDEYEVLRERMALEHGYVIFLSEYLWDCNISFGFLENIEDDADVTAIFNVEWTAQS